MHMRKWLPPGRASRLFGRTVAAAARVAGRAGRGRPRSAAAAAATARGALPGRPAGRVLALVLLPLALVACGRDAPPGGDGGALVLWYEQYEPGIEPYTTRITVTPQFLRMDDGIDDGDFVLLDRASGDVYSVAHGERRILVVHRRPVMGESPIPLRIDARRHEEPDAPAIEGHRPVRYELLVNDRVCSQVVAVPGLLPEAVRALREFRRSLAGQHSDDLPKTPVEYLDPCFLSMHVFSPGRNLQYGIPLREWDEQGAGRALLRYERGVTPGEGLFELPADYERSTVPALAG